MFITYITDCADPNAIARQGSRLAGLFNTTPTFAPVRATLDSAAELEAAGMLVDVLDAAGESAGVVLVNVAPRSGSGAQYHNGTPFGHFTYRNVRVLSTLSGVTLSLAKTLGCIETLHAFDLSKTVSLWREAGLVSTEESERIVRSQFRSFDFLPRAAHALFSNQAYHTENYPLENIPTVEPSVFFIDNFGNVKTTLLAREVEGQVSLDTSWGELPLVHSLHEVPEGEAACIEGSSGLGDQRFIELVIQGGRAADALNVRVGDSVFRRQVE